MPASASELERLERSWAVLLTTFKRDGTAVATPVNLAVEGARAYFRSYAKAWKTKRLRRDAKVELAPSSPRGKPRPRRLGDGTAARRRGGGPCPHPAGPTPPCFPARPHPGGAPPGQARDPPLRGDDRPSRDLDVTQRRTLTRASVHWATVA